MPLAADGSDRFKRGQRGETLLLSLTFLLPFVSFMNFRASVVACEGRCGKAICENGEVRLIAIARCAIGRPWEGRICSRTILPTHPNQSSRRLRIYLCEGNVFRF